MNKVVTDLVRAMKEEGKENEGMSYKWREEVCGINRVSWSLK